jgi:sporulation protein YlmC with PRC-barrel domain
MATAQTDGLQSNQARPDTVSDMFGLKVYTSSGVYLGVVEDVKLDFRQDESTGLALTDVNPEVQEAAGSGEGVIIPYSWVESVHDVVMTIDILKRLSF